jgi:hypothetical protein
MLLDVTSSAGGRNQIGYGICMDVLLMVDWCDFLVQAIQSFA